MRPALALLALPLVLTACALTPRQQCEAPYRNQLAGLNREIRATTQLLQDGYRYAPSRFSISIGWCQDNFGDFELCHGRDDTRQRFDRQPINRAAEQAKLDSLIAQRKPFEAGIAACAQQYPEG